MVGLWTKAEAATAFDEIEVKVADDGKLLGKEADDEDDDKDDGEDK